METIRLTDQNVNESVQKATAVLRNGGVVLYPTDTLYGLGADAFNDDAVGKVYDIKERSDGKLVHCIVADLEMAERYGTIDDNARALASAFLPGALTLILKKKLTVATGIARDASTIGIRIPDSRFCIELAKAFDGPYTTTSANKSGEPPERTIEKILSQLPGSGEIDLAIDAGELHDTKASTVVDVSTPQPVILREGMITAAEIWEVLRTEP